MIPTQGKSCGMPAKAGKNFLIGINKMPTLLTVNQFTEKQPAFNIGGLRSLIFNENQNGLAKSGAIIRIGRKVLIDESKFFAWVESQNRGEKQ